MSPSEWWSSVIEWFSCCWSSVVALSNSWHIQVLICCSISLVLLLHFLISKMSFFIDNWWFCSGWWSLGKLEHWLLNDFINLISDLIYLVFSIKVLSHYFISFNEWIKFTLEFSILGNKELRVWVQWFKFLLKIVISIKKSIIAVSYTF